jgi:hypothetical protein
MPRDFVVMDGHLRQGGYYWPWPHLLFALAQFLRLKERLRLVNPFQANYSDSRYSWKLGVAQLTLLASNSLSIGETWGFRVMVDRLSAELARRVSCQKGKLITNVVPDSSEEVARMVPEWASTFF